MVREFLVCFSQTLQVEFHGEQIPCLPWAGKTKENRNKTLFFPFL
jgi:hypothetical protein